MELENEKKGKSFSSKRSGVLLWFALVFLSARTSAYSFGCYTRACEDMVPGHSSGGDSDEEFTASINTTSNCYTPNIPFEIVVRDSKGFLGVSLQVRKAATQQRAEGEFSNFDQELFKLIDCPPGRQNYWTSKVARNKTQASLTWTSPSQQGDLLLVYTLVRNFGTYCSRKNMTLNPC